jgi:hypothetical protein
MLEVEHRPNFLKIIRRIKDDSDKKKRREKKCSQIHHVN